MSKDAAFEEVEAIYLEQVEQVKALVFKQGYDIGLSDAGVSEDSPSGPTIRVLSPTIPPTTWPFRGPCIGPSWGGYLSQGQR